MKLFAIGDLHLSFNTPVNAENLDKITCYKPMDVCSPLWKDHYKKIYHNWNKLVEKEDVVLVPGDISWAMKIDEVIYDMQYLGMLNGLIVAIPGNHDYWWQSISKVRRVVPPNMKAIQNDHVIINDIAICGTRGWICPGSSTKFDSHDEKIYRREVMRLENSLSSVKTSVDDIIVMMHYMPTNEKHERSGFIEVLEKYNVKTVVYGHLHANAKEYRLPETKWGINFYLVSADFVNFTPVLIQNL